MAVVYHIRRMEMLMLFLLAAFLTFTDGFVTTTTSVRPIKLLLPARCSPRTTALQLINDSNMVTSLATKMFPPIPDRVIDSNRNVTAWSLPAFKNIMANQLNPGFIRKEFLIGFRYMLHRFKWLCSASILCHCIRHFLIKDLPQQQLIMLKSFSSPIHCAEISFKDLFLRKMSPQWRAPLGALTVGPIAEEVAYRGICHTAIQAQFFLQLFFNAWLLANFNVGLLYTKLVASAYVVLHEGWHAGKTLHVTMQGWLFAFTTFEFIVRTIPTLELVKMKKKAAMGSKKEKEEEEVVLEIEEEGTAKRQRTFSDDLVSTSIGNPAALASAKFTKKVQQSNNLLARVYGAFEFGYSHVGSGMLPLATASIHLQKGLGTFLSSLLVESRLAVIRKNLWAPIGAHVAFNLMAHLFQVFLNVLFIMLERMKSLNIGV